MKLKTAIGHLWIISWSGVLKMQDISKYLKANKKW